MTQIFRAVLWGAAFIAAAFSVSTASAQGGGDDGLALRETHGAWEIRCLSDSDCLMQQVVLDDAGEVLMIFRLRKFEEVASQNGVNFVGQALFVTKDDYYLPADIVMQIDEGQPERFPFERCSRNTCLSVLTVTDSGAESLKAGGEVKFFMAITPNNSEQAIFSLQGFTAAFNAL